MVMIDWRMPRLVASNKVKNLDCVTTSQKYLRLPMLRMMSSVVFLSYRTGIGAVTLKEIQSTRLSAQHAIGQGITVNDTIVFIKEDESKPFTH